MWTSRDQPKRSVSLQFQPFTTVPVGPKRYCSRIKMEPAGIFMEPLRNISETSLEQICNQDIIRQELK